MVVRGKTHVGGVAVIIIIIVFIFIMIIIIIIIVIIILIMVMKVRHMWEGSPSEETIMKELTQENGEVFSKVEPILNLPLPGMASRRQMSRVGVHW